MDARGGTVGRKGRGEGKRMGREDRR